MDRDNLIIETLDTACRERDLRFQVVTEPDLLHIYINRKSDRAIDYDNLSEIIKEAILSLNIPDLGGLWLYSRVYGELESDWDTFIELVACPVTSGDGLDSIANSKCIFPPEAMEKIDSEKISQDSSISEQKSELEANFHNSPYAEYCFINNKGLLTNHLLPPQTNITKIVRFLHNLPDVAKVQVLPLLAEYFKTRKIPQLEDFSLGIQNWFQQITQLSQPESRKAAIWLSRYCFAPATTMSQIEKVSAIETPAAECEVVASNNNDVPYYRRQKTDPLEKESQLLDTQGNILLLPMSWITLTFILIILGVNNASYSPRMTNICQKYANSLEYCQLATDMVGKKNIDTTLTQTANLSFTPKQKTWAAYACQRYANVRSGIPFKDADPNKMPVISNSGERVLGNLFTVTATQKNLLPQGTANIRVGCVYASGKKEKFPVLLASDTIPNNWPQQAYQPKAKKLSPKSFGVFWLPIFLGISTIFATVGISVATAFGLGMRVDSLQTVYLAALILSILESTTVNLPVFGLAANITLQSLALGGISLFVKGFKIDWNRGYKLVTAGGVAVMGTKWILRWMLYLLLYSLVS